MAATLKRRGSLIAALLLVLGLAGVLATASFRGAEAQTERVFWIITLSDSGRASNGHLSPVYDFSEFGANPVIHEASCTGRSPRTGPNIPAMVVTQVVAADRIALRILHNNGTPMNASVTFNCVVGVETDATPAAQPTSVLNKTTGASVKLHAVKS